MKTITITEAKRSLGAYLKRAAAGEEIGIVSGADIISLRKVAVVPADRMEGGRVREAAGLHEEIPRDFYELETFRGGPANGAANHDEYVYRRPRGK